LTPRTPDPFREDLKLFSGYVHCILFDFDGTLTATPGQMVARQGQKTAELCERAAMIAPPLRILRDANILLGIISKSTEATIRSSLQAAGLSEFFTGPIIGKAVGLEGKAGFIEDLIVSGHLGHSDTADLETALQQILLIDDDVRELDRARARGIQTFPAPANGGMRDEDFNDVLAGLGFCLPKPRQQPSTASLSPSGISVAMSASPSSRM
jgi:phosphoglycolate phosphatase-like HAD superfamily hydrolase